jgi:hypothetical protein
VSRFILIALLLGALGGWHWWTTERPVHRPPGIVAPDEPQQVDLDPPETFAAKGYQFTARARFVITARLLRKEIYRIDGGAGLAPVDLGVGWGPLSDSAILDQLDFSQMGRFFYWQPKSGRFPLPAEMLITHMAQMHMIPSTKAIEDRLRSLRPGQLVTATGYLVDVRGPNGFTWSTSMTRTDTGAGACEIVWVEALDAN